VDPDNGVLADEVAGAQPVQGQPAVRVLALHRQLVVPVLRLQHWLPLQAENGIKFIGLHNCHQLPDYDYSFDTGSGYEPKLTITFDIILFAIIVGIPYLAVLV
jgi:hypothetical protein